MSIREAKAALVNALTGTGIAVMGVTMQYGGEKRATQIVTIKMQRSGKEPEEVVLEVPPGGDIPSAVLAYAAETAAPIKIAKAEQLEAARKAKGA